MPYAFAVFDVRLLGGTVVHQICLYTNRTRSLSRYGVYAAVFLHKALCTRVFRSSAERREVTELALEFTSTIENASAVQPHICREYGRMLRNLWHQVDISTDRVPHRSDNTDANLNASTHSAENAQQLGNQGRDSVPERVSSEFNTAPSTGPDMQVAGSGGPADAAARDQGTWHGLEGMEPQFGSGYLDLGNDMGALHSVEGYFAGSFLPGVTDFGQQGHSDSSMPGLDDGWMGGF